MDETLEAIMQDVYKMRLVIRDKMDDIEDQGASDIKMFGLYAAEYITLTNVMELIAGYRRKLQ